MIFAVRPIKPYASVPNDLTIYGVKKKLIKNPATNAAIAAVILSES